MVLQAGMDVSHHGGSAYFDEASLMEGNKPANGLAKHSPGMESEVIVQRTQTRDEEAHKLFALHCSQCTPARMLKLGSMRGGIANFGMNITRF